MISVTNTELYHHSKKTAIDSMQTNELDFVQIALYLWALKFEFHVIFHVSQNMVLLNFFQSFKNVKIILRVWAVQMLVMDWIGPLGQNLPSPALLHCLSHTPAAPRSRLSESACFPLPAQGLYCSNALSGNAQLVSLNLCPRLAHPGELW